MTLEYTITREEINKWYWQNWRKGFWKIHLFAFISAFVIVLLVRGAWPTGFVGVVEASLIAAGIIGAFMYYPQLMFKPQQRTLTVSDEGIETTIGRKHGKKKWSEVAKIEETPQEIIITGLRGNAFLVPQRAFHSLEERTNFITSIKAWQSGAEKDASIHGSFARGEYGWWFSYIFFIVLAGRLGGAIGAVGATLILFGLYKTVKSKNYSKKQKAVISIAYVVGGMIATFVAIIVFTIIIRSTTGTRYTPLAQEILNATPSNEVVTAGAAPSPSTVTVNERSATTTALSSSKTKVSAGSPSETLTSGLEKIAYSNSEYNFEVHYPTGWTVNNGASGVVVEFDDPTPNLFAAMLIDIDKHVGSATLKQYAAGFMQGAQSYNNNKTFQLINQGSSSINNIPSYFVEFSYDYTLPNGQIVPLHSNLNVLIHQGVGYSILATSQEQLWNQYRNLFSESSSTFTPR